MSHTKIQHITPQGTYEWNGSTMFKYDVILEDGQVGQVSTKRANKWKQGDVVVVKNVVHSDHGIRLSLDRPHGQWGLDKGAADMEGTFPSKAQSKEESIMAQWAIREALKWVEFTSHPDKVSLYDVWGYAQRFKQMATKFDEWGSDYKEEWNKRQATLSPENCPPVEGAPTPTDDDLPF